ncbi:MAG TPA: DegT/DnrJ/EryC1/StrS family aminotransferase [Solirubrobacteraceae bacterium]|nr:DegT/DnrJ/EryC1/StrS family aminotransferase [Solirubrobacteraceae bacterium]
MSSVAPTHEPAPAGTRDQRTANPTSASAGTRDARAASDTRAAQALAATHEPARGLEVPFTRMDNADPALFEELMGAVREVAERGAFTLGHHVEAFERDFAEYCETDCAVGVASGTEALALALRALEIGPGDEVIVPANSFIATAEAVSAVGATPRPVDVDPDTHLITAELIAASLGPRVRCVIPVHLFGATVDLDPILELAREAGVHVLEDACQAHGARYRGRRVGTFGALGCFSFYPAKNLGAWGDGGAVVTAHSDLAERVRLLRSHGERPRYHHREVGATARLDALQAAILRRKLTRLEGWNDERRRVGEVLRARLASADAGTSAIENVRALAAHGGHGANGTQGAAAARTGLRAVEPVRPPVAEGDHVYHLFVVRCAQRDALREHLAAEGVASAIHYPVPIHRTEAYSALGLAPGSLPVSEALAERICSLPVFPGMSDAELDRIVEAVERFTKDDPPRER